MHEIRLGTVAFPGRGSYSAKMDFAITNKAGVGQVTITIDLWRKESNDVNSSAYVLAIDDADAVREGRRKLHEFATLLAERTKDWAAPSTAEALRP